jgi:hypothetical protein
MDLAFVEYLAEGDHIDGVGEYQAGSEELWDLLNSKI